MAPYLLWFSLLAATTFAVTSLATPEAKGYQKCTKPTIRREWRALGHAGQKAFADAIKVCWLSQARNPC
jgi:hypothetical protein